MLGRSSYGLKGFQGVGGFGEFRGFGLQGRRELSGSSRVLVVLQGLTGVAKGLVGFGFAIARPFMAFWKGC